VGSSVGKEERETGIKYNAPRVTKRTAIHSTIRVFPSR
jgi:hypothetical protein